MYYFIHCTTLFIFVCLIHQTDNFLLKNRISKIKIGSFNLRRYSLAKATLTSSVNLHISKILKRYDLVFLQEIIDASNDNRVINHLLNHLHKQSKSIKYEAIISSPLGLTSYKERLVYLYRKKSSHIQILSSYVYNGSVSKMFERPPFILHIKLSSFGQIIFIGVHLKPDNVYNEFRFLRTVIDEFKEQSSSIILLGDFNADCSYLNNAKKKEIRTSYFNEFQWLIDDRTETNLLQSCSYDRILVSSGINHWKKVNWKAKTNGTFEFDKKFKLTKQLALQISDHYPIEVDIY
ncbi:unnamed protein product [Adineta steineri]|uniref:Deoxyribonuclease n=2 Tax=Adineta steineri TaxID=433720 RepID=A0A815NY63_9BILA|nr:unnamed protein product [Adineta steineri]CAF3991697.1 unnamed protein product [Adineta steineri]